MGYSKVSVLIPTRGRVKRLETLVNSFVQTVDDDESAELVFRVDDDDVETRGFLSQVKDCKLVVGPRCGGYSSLPAFFNEMLKVATGDVLMCGNDDMVFRSLWWVTAILDEANRHPDGLFDLGVMTHNHEHFPFSTISRRAADRMGFVWDPRIFWGDIFLRDVMAFFGRAIYVPVKIDHDWAGHAPDGVFIEGNEQRMLPRGADYWEGVHRPAVNQAIDKLRGLQS
jgi:glycosyltransferase involved in cell wall biosynthesis